MGGGEEPDDFVIALDLADLGEEALEEQVVVGLRRPHGCSRGEGGAVAVRVGSRLWENDETALQIQSS